MGKNRKPLGALAVIALAALLLSTVALAVEADAARGGNGGGKGTKGGGGGGTTSSATLTVSPSSVPAGTTSIVISGSGFGANRTLGVGPRGVIPTMGVTTDANGSFSITYTPWDGGFNIPGPYPVDAIDASRGTVLATTVFTVY